MKVLSLFDGISCGQLALEKAGIKVDKYYASEIDDNAIKVKSLISDEFGMIMRFAIVSKRRSKLKYLSFWVEIKSGVLFRRIIEASEPVKVIEPKYMIDRIKGEEKLLR